MSKAKQITPMTREIANTFAEYTECNRLIAALETYKKIKKAELDKMYGKRGRVKQYKQGQGIKRARSILINLLGEECSRTIETGKEFTVENAIVPKDAYTVAAHNAHQFIVKVIE